MQKRASYWGVLFSLCFAVSIGGCAPAPGEHYVYQGEAGEGGEALDVEGTTRALSIGKSTLGKSVRTRRLQAMSAREIGGSCGNDGDTYTIDEGDCVYSMMTVCKWASATTPGGETYTYCGCSDVMVGKDCPEEVETPEGDDDDRGLRP